MLALGALICVPGLAHAETLPTLIIDVHNIGPERLAQLKALPGVGWSVEFGSEMLLGVQPGSLKMISALPLAKPGPGASSLDELLVFGHACGNEKMQPLWGSVGGYDLVRVPALSAKLRAISDPMLMQIPSNRVFARARANEPAPPVAAPIAKNVADAISDIVARVDAERWFQTMSNLSSFNRNSYSTGLFSARDWIRARFIEQGLTPSDFEFTLANITSCTPTPPPINLPNIIGRKQGARLPNEWIVIGAHYDSRNPSRCDGINNPQPGANDNASGCAGAIELANVFANVRTERSILFMCFSGEEQGLVGSRRYVDSLVASGEINKVKLMINLDMIGFAINDTHTARIESNSTHQNLIDELSASAALHAPELTIITSVNANGGSDHVPFLQAGVPTAFTWENGATVYPHYHLASDLPANMSRARVLAGGILKMDAAVIAARAGLIPADEFADGFEGGLPKEDFLPDSPQLIAPSK